LGADYIETVNKYKYLGVLFSEKGDFSEHCDNLGKAGGRALGAVISKVHSLKNTGFKTFEKLYVLCVVPVLDYCSAIWGFRNDQQIDNIQNRAIRYYLGVHRFTPVLALTGDTGWLPSIYPFSNFDYRTITFDKYYSI
jgi:hypothetical protein